MRTSSILSVFVVVVFFQHLRSIGVVGKFVEFFGPGVGRAVNSGQSYYI